MSGRLGALLFFVLTAATTVLAQRILEPSGVAIEVTGTGAFSIQFSETTWIYSGNIPGHGISITGPVSGFDDHPVSTNGPFDELTVNYSDPDGNPWRMQLRGYRRSPSALISFSPLVTAPNRRPYAVLNQFPITAHHFSNAGWNRSFGLVGWMDTDSPWLFFDDTFNASILSAASRPMSERQVWVNDGSKYGLIALKVDSNNAVLPAGDVYSHLITFGQGIGQTFTTWGSILRNIAGRPITGNQSDLSLRVPMLSTDAGATYYYSFDWGLGYEGTLRAAIASAKTAGIPIGIVQFDSWWYLKGGNCDAIDNPAFASWDNGDAGVWKFVADPSLFQPINPGDWDDGFIQNLGPGMAHGRWVDDCSPYRLPVSSGASGQSQQPVSGNVIIDPDIWAAIAQALKKSGMVIFEQDFLASYARAADTFDDEEFLNVMATAMAAQRLDLQFCMPLARHIMEAFRYEHVHTIRVSGDRFDWIHWDAEMYGAMIVNAGSVWPTVDSFHTTEEKNLLLAVLSAGPLALSDAIGGFVPIPEAIRSDGLILKPDFSMIPTDASIVAEAAAIEQFYGVSGPTASNTGNKATLILPPLVGHTYSEFETNKVEYVFAYSRDLNAAATVTFSPQDFGFSGNVYVYDYFSKIGWRQPAAQTIARSVDSQGSYFVIAPVGPSGIAFVGDLSRFVPASKQRVSSLTDNGQITASLEFTQGETVPISMYASSMPVVFAQGATVSPTLYDSATGLYQVLLTPGQNTQATVRIALAGAQ